jgi:hypothetical protein
MHKQLNSLVKKEMTRKEFVATLGFGAATVMGFGSVLKLLGAGSHNTKQHAVSGGYGSSPYGGGKET